MKKIVCIFLVVLFAANLLAALDLQTPDTHIFNDVPIGSSGWLFNGFPDDHLYSDYLADPHSIHVELSYTYHTINEITPNEFGTGNRFKVAPACRFSLLRFSPQDLPNHGIEIEIGGVLPAYMEADDFDLISFDGIFNLGLSMRFTDWFALRFSRHHICSHVGDEHDITDTGFAYADYDTSIRMTTESFVRDDWSVSVLVEPLFFLGKTAYGWERVLKAYGDLFFYSYGSDIIRERHLKPFDHAYIWYKYGLELELPVISEKFGFLYTALNISRWQQSSFVPNLSIEAGYIFPADKGESRFRVGASYYDGQSVQNNFNTRREQYLGVELSVEL